MSARSNLTAKDSKAFTDTKDLKPEPLEIFPPEIVFRDIEPEQTYEVTVSVRNLSTRVRRIRFVPPKTSKFLAEYETQGSIAGGIQTLIVISFETDHPGNFHDEMMILSEDFVYSLKLHALEPAPEIHFQPFLNLGLTSIYKDKHAVLVFKNEGSRGGKVSLNYDRTISPELMLDPSSFFIDSGKTAEVSAVYSPKEVGIFRCPVEVEVEGQDIIRHIDVNATCVDHQMSIVAPNMERKAPKKKQLAVTTSLNFGNMYHGEVKQIEAFLINNGPSPVDFTVQFMQGAEEDMSGQNLLVTTPQEQALVEMKRVMKAEPNKGVVEPYSQFRILFECHSKVIEKAKGFVKTMMEESNPMGEFSTSNLVDNVIDYFYTAVFFFPELETSLNLQLQARAVLPSVKISHNSIFFPDCPANDRRDFIIKLENANEELPIDFSVSKVAHFSVAPGKGKLLPLETKSLIFTFNPKNLGVFHSLMAMSFIKDAYKVPILVYGKSAGIAVKTKELRGPDSLPENFHPQRKYAGETEVNFNLKDKKLTDTIRTDYSVQEDQQILNKAVKQQYTDFLRQSRKQRLGSKSQMLKSRKLIRVQTLEEIETDPALGVNPKSLKDKQIQLPKAVDPLYVKNIGAIEKAHDSSKPVKNSSKKFAEKGKFREIPFATEPTRPMEIAECSRVLTPDELQSIYATPQILTFDKVVVATPISKWLSIVNDLQNHIWVKLQAHFPEIYGIEPTSLVIPPGMRGGFRITLMSRSAQMVEGVVGYTINNSHTFNFIVRGNIEPAVLSLSKQFIHFVFEDDDMEETLCEKVIVRNECNADTRFVWKLAAGSNFEVEPKEDIVEALKSKPVIIKFAPTLNSSRSEEETLLMQVDNGPSCALKVKGDFTEAKCMFLQKNLDFEVVSMGIKYEKVASIKNQLRTAAVFHIKRVPSEFTVTPSKGRIPGDGKLNLKVEFCSYEEQKLNIELEVLIRGGKSLILPITAQAIVPKVYIKETELDFGGVTYKCSSFKNFSIVNESPIEALLYINLEEHPEFEISMPMDGNEGEVESMILAPATGDRNNPFNPRSEEDDLEDIKAEGPEEDSDDEPDEIAQTFRLHLAPHSTVKLQLKFTPSDTETYMFDLPIKLAGINEPPKSLTRPVSGEGLLPRFLIDPSVVFFKKKYITFGEKSFPDYKDVIFSNPDIYPLKWRLDTSSIDSEKTFSVKPTEGYLEPAASVTVRVSFNPTQPIDHEEKVYLYLAKSTEPYLELVLKGEGAVPRISFDRRQVIMPVVPLGITSKAIFRINNEGYQNVELRYRFIKDLGRIPLTVICPDGLNLGATRQRIPIEIQFNSEKPMSFITWIEFFDGEGNRFSLPIQATADNCLFTNFPFLQRHLDDIRIEVNTQGRITIFQESFSDNDEHSGHWGHGVRTSGASSVYSRSAKSIIGYHPIPTYLLDKGLEYLTKWLNHNILTNSINKFPDDFILQHGVPLYELIQVLSGRNPPGQIKNPHSLQAKELARQLHRQYEELLEYLKKQGALLNTIRPEFLLSQADYVRYLKSTPLELQFTNKQIQHRWPYMSMDAWTTLIYQILKIYLLNRVNVKSFKTLPGINPEEAVIDPSMTSSNLLSISENILLKWLTYHFSVYSPQYAKRITNFDNDLMDGTVLASVVQSHTGHLKSLAPLKMNPTSDDQRQLNCERLIAALHEIGLPTFLTGNDLARPSARENLLFVIKLFNGLPHYLPKAMVSFSCPLGEKVMKKIELSNPGQKAIHYWVKLEGSKDFFNDGFDSVTLNPKSSVEYPIYFKSRITTPEQRAKLSFTNKSEGGALAAALVFELCSDVKPPISVPTLEVHTSLYKVFNKEIEIKNTYGTEAEFTIQLKTIEEVKKPLEKKGYRRNAQVEQPTTQFPTPFFIKNEKIKIKKNATAYITMQYLPFEMKTHKAELVLCDEHVGELHFMVVGTVGMPEVTEIPTIKAEMGDSVTINVPIDTKNKNLEYAKVKCRERYQSNQKAKEREQLNEIFKKITGEDSVVYEITLSSPYFNGPNTIALADPSKLRQKLADTSGISDMSRNESLTRGKKSPSRASHSSIIDQVSKLTLSCSPRSPGEYTCTIILTSLKKTDIRVYELSVQVKPKKHVITLEMTGYARTETVQEIPVVNNSERDWSVKVNLVQETKDFAASRDLQVKKQSTGYCKVVFAPIWVCESTAKLIIEIPATGEVHEFILKGTAEEPRAEKHLIIDCKVKESATTVIFIPNSSDLPVRYTVESDMDITSGDPSILVPAKTMGEYELTVRPIQSGIYSGAITFYDANDRFYWYTIETRALEPEPEDVKSLVVQCRKAVELKITVFNPYDEATTFEVTTTGAGLLGDSVFYLSAHETGIYELLYSPLIPGESYGSVSFISERTGEFWYKLRLVALEPEPIELEPFQCELGRTSSQKITLENPTGEEVILDYYCSNPLNYELVPEKIILPPYEIIEAHVRYSPSSLKNTETAEIRLNSSALGDWIYRLSGRGTSPGLMSTIEISATLDESSSAQITFKNPFREAVDVRLSLESPDQTFQLLVRRQTFALTPLGVLLIPISYYPRSMEDYSAVLVVSITEDLTWKYPIKGVTVSPSSHIDYTFKVKCRNAFEQNLAISLTDITGMREEENFSHEIRVPDPALQSYVDKSLMLEPVKNILTNLADCLEFNVKFEPLRPFKGQVELVISKASGGRWIYNILLEAQEPDIDDVITIESPIGKASSVAFKLSNQFKSFAEFEAYFTPESDACFMVQPSSGILEPYGREGTTFIVSFTPIEYGAPKVGKLIIVTEDMRWTYLIKGSHPHYNPPEVPGGRIDNKLKKQLQPVHSKKNFIRGNMKQLSPKRSGSMKSLK